MSGAIKIYTYCTEEDKESGHGVKTEEQEGVKVRRNSGAQQLQDHVTRFSQHCRACVSCSRPTREIFAQNLATLCARSVQLEPGAAIPVTRVSNRYSEVKV